MTMCISTMITSYSLTLLFVSCCFGRLTASGEEYSIHKCTVRLLLSSLQLNLAGYCLYRRGYDALYFPFSLPRMFVEFPLAQHFDWRT